MNADPVSDILWSCQTVAPSIGLEDSHLYAFRSQSASRSPQEPDGFFHAVPSAKPQPSQPQPNTYEMNERPQGPPRMAERDQEKAI